MHQIDVKRSKVEWTGRNLTGAHSGTIKQREGSIKIKSGRPVSSSLTLEMGGIKCTDLKDGKMRKMQEAHLKAENFFDVERFPEAQFLMSKITPLPDSPLGKPNFQIPGDLTLKGATRELSLRAILAPTPDGLLAADAHFDIDRTHWNVLFGSGKFYENLGKHLINDEISIALKLVTSQPKRPFQNT